MAVWTHSDEDPLFRVQGHPIYITELLIIVYATFFILLALAQYFLGLQAILVNMALSTTAVIVHEKLWQLLTYPLINPMNLWFAVEMVMLFIFGREVERSVGRRAFLFLYLGMIIVPAVALSGLSLLAHEDLAYNGSANLHFCLFIAFALLFPNVQLYFGVLAKWMALIFVAVVTLIDLAHHDWSDLVMLWTGIGVAAFAIRLSFVSDWIDWLQERKARNRFGRQQKAAAKIKALEDSKSQSIDQILEKISREGLRSLTREEKASLERARLELLKREEKKKSA